MEEKRFELSRGSAITILTILSLLWLINFADRSIMTVVLEAVKADLRLTDAQAGGLVAMVTAGIAILTIPASIFGDRWARRKVIAVMAVIWSAATLATAFCINLGQMLAARFLVGAGEAGYSPVGQAWLSVSFRKEIRSLIIGIFFAFSQLGMVIGLVVGGWLLTATGDWRVPFYVFAIPGIILAIIVLFLPDYRTVREQGEAVLSKSYFKSWADIFKCKSYLLPTIAGIFFLTTVVAVTVWTPAILMRAYDMDAAAAGRSYGLVSLVLLFAPLGGLIADRWQKRNKSGRPLFMALTVFLALIVFAAAFLSIGQPVQLFLALLSLGTFFVALNLPVGFTVVNDVIAPGLRSTALGISVLVMQLFGATLGTVAVGAISDRLGGGASGLQWGLIWTLPVFALAIVTNLMLAKYYPADSAKCSDLVYAEK
ncbi:MAG: MFS transporter [Chloroflexi bacterium]|nr:MFS transporter [Chloroflexota bacterium]